MKRLFIFADKNNLSANLFLFSVIGFLAGITASSFLLAQNIFYWLFSAIIILILFSAFVGLLQNNFSTAISRFWLHLVKNFSTILMYCLKIFNFGSPKIWESRNESYFAKGLIFKKYCRLILILLVFIIFCGLGFLRGEAAELKIAVIAGDLPLSQEIVLRLKVLNIDRRSDFKNLEAVIINQKEKILIRTDLSQEIHQGDIITIRGKIQKPTNFSSDFDYISFLARQGILYQSFYPRIEKIPLNPPLNKGGKSLLLPFIKGGWEGFGRSLSVVRLNALKKINQYFLPPESDFLSAVILGEKNIFSKNFADLLNRSGTRHLAAISGLHMALVSVIIMELLFLLGLWRQQAFWVAVVLMVVFIIFVGSPPSAIRAGIMAGLLLLSREAGRINYSSRAICLAAAIMLLVNPSLLRFDLGFQLSFAAVLGIILLVPILDNYLKFIPRGNLKNILTMTLAAQIAVFPILTTNFGSVSIIAPLSNLILVGLMPFLMVGGIIFVFSSFISNILARLFSFIFWPLLKFFTWLIETTGSFSLAAVNVRFGYLWVFLYYLCLILFIIFWRRSGDNRIFI